MGKIMHMTVTEFATDSFTIAPSKVPSLFIENRLPQYSMMPNFYPRLPYEEWRRICLVLRVFDNK